jgi:hypothetical protein
LSTGSANTAIGGKSLDANTGGTGNTAVGRDSLGANTTGGSNTAVGLNSLLYNATGSDNTAIGTSALGGVGATGGSYDIAIGAYALSQTDYTGSGNIQIGGLNAAGQYNPCGTLTNHTNYIIMGSNNVTNARIKVNWTISSDVRDKTELGTVPHGLNFVCQLNPISYRFRVNRGTDQADGPQRYGFKAQDILALEGENPVIIDSGEPESLCMNETQMIPVLVNAMKEMSAKIDELSERINRFENP